MTRSHMMLAAAALLLPACQVNEAPANGAGETNLASTNDARADEQAIRAQVDQWHKLIKAKNAAAIAALYTDDGAVMPPNSPIGKGADIEKTWASLIATPGFDLQIIPEQIVVSSSGDMAMDRGTYKLAMAPSGAAMSDTGKYVVVWRKVDGVWKAAADIFNSDLPANAG